MSSELAIADDQEFWSDKQVAALTQIGVNRASNADLAVFFHQCARTGLDPFARQIYMIERQGKQTIQTGIDGFRLIGRRAVDRSGETLEISDTEWFDATSGRWVEVWLSKEPPAAARVSIIRNGGRFPAIAMWDEYAGKKSDGNLTKMWADRGAGQLAKCAEALAWRKAFPLDLSGLYTVDEMSRANAEVDAPAARSQGRGRQSLAETLNVADDPSEPVDAEVVDVPLLSAQVGKIADAFKALDIPKDDRLDLVRAHLGNPDLAGVGDLTFDDAERLIGILEQDVATLRSEKAQAATVRAARLAEDSRALGEAGVSASDAATAVAGATQDDPWTLDDNGRMA